MTDKTAVEALAENALKTRFEDLDQETIETIKGRVIDILGCAIGGANASGNRELIDLVKGYGAKARRLSWSTAARCWSRTRP